MESSCKDCVAALTTEQFTSAQKTARGPNARRSPGSLPFVRLPLALLCGLLLAATASAQRTSGTYRGVPWSIDANLSLNWNGTPYTPVGLRIDGSPRAIAEAADAGIRDLVVELSPGAGDWRETIEALESRNLRYLIAVNSLAPMARGIAVEPQSYRIAGITKAQKVEVRIPEAVSALVILASRRDGVVQSHARVPVVNGLLTHEIGRIAELEHVLLIYPETLSLEQPDLWERLDGHRDALLHAVARAEPGAGLRGIVNPMGRFVTLPSREPQFVPTSPFFRMEYAAYLEAKYRSFETALRSFAVGAYDGTSFEDLARLVPLWSGSRGVPMVWDPKTNKLYSCNRNTSVIWSDLSQTLSAATTRRYERLVASLRRQANVPIVQEWSGWAAPYEGAPLVDGIGMRAHGGSYAELIEGGSRPASSLLRWSRPGWLIASDLDLGVSPEAAGRLPSAVEDLASLGMRAFFFRPGSEELVRSAAAQAAPAASLAFVPQAIFFPENALNPAAAMRLPGGHWWLPSPLAGNRIDLGTEFFGYRLGREGATMALWARSGPQRVKLRMLQPRTASFATLDGTDPQPRLVRDGVEVTLTTIPLLITGTSETPIPEPALVETVRVFEDLLANLRSGGDVSEERVFFKEHHQGFDRNPSGNFPILRQHLARLTRRAAVFTWIEGENSRDTDFGDVETAPGCSNGAALTMQTRIPSPTGTYFALYPLPVRTQLEQEVWIAARIPEARRKDVVVNIGGQNLVLAEAPLSPYGHGYAWYRLGRTRLAGHESSLRVTVRATDGADISIDAILLTPEPFSPNGAAMPNGAMMTGRERS
jgi:hypothetical protein